MTNAGLLQALGDSPMIPTWAELRRLGENRVLRSAPVWFVFVPIAANILESLAASSVPWVSATGLTNLRLPFSWQVFFFASLFVAAANAVFEVFCPRVIRDHRSWRHFLEERNTERDILAALIDVLLRSSLLHRTTWWRHCDRVLRAHIFPFFQNAMDVKGLMNESEGQRTPTRLTTILHRGELAVESRAEFASVIWELADRNLGLARLMTTGLYAGGGALAGFVMLQNIQTVIRTL
jgi:hypothetical protein